MSIEPDSMPLEMSREVMSRSRLFPRHSGLLPTLQNIVVLGVLVLIRTFLSWSLVVEIEGRWPWKKREEANPDTKQRIGTTLPQGTTAPTGATEAKIERRK